MSDFLTEVLPPPFELAVMIAIAAALFTIRAVYLFRRAAVTRTWRPVDAVITWSQVEDRQVKEWFATYSQHRPDIRYSYQIGTKDYEGNRVYFGADEWGTRTKEAREIVGRYPPGVRVTAYVDPARPTEAILERGQTKAARAIMTVTVVAGLLAVGLYIYSRTHPTF